jgi:indolepyruvate decarboxylase
MTAQQTSRPVYIELPNDMVSAPAGVPEPLPAAGSHDEQALAEAVKEAAAMINAAEHPVVMAGVELARFGLQEEFAGFLDQTGLPFVTTLMGKSVITEKHERFAGVYEGGMCREDVRQFVEESDCLLLMGAMMTDINTGIFSAQLDPNITISANAEQVQIRRHFYHNAPLGRFLQALKDSGLKNRAGLACPRPQPPASFEPQTGQPLTVSRFFQCLNSKISDDHAVIADPGDALFGAADLVIHGQAEFISSAYYASLGFAVPASIGVQAADPGKRPLVLVGDGAFQMTGVELSCAARYQFSPIVLVLNNDGFGTERPMIDGPFNDVHHWAYTSLPDLLGPGHSRRVETEEQLVRALEEAQDVDDRFFLIEVVIPRGDFSAALKRLTDRLGKRTRS